MKPSNVSDNLHVPLAAGPMKPTDAKHTPGPWRIGQSNCVFGASRYVGSDEMSQLVCACTTGGLYAQGKSEADLQREADANAELIASAPELLAERDALRAEVSKLRAALTRVVAHDGDCIRQDQWFELRDAARIALAPTT